jgi:predicted aspartyl protease
LPLTFESSRHISAIGTIAGKSQVFIVDTGASVTVIDVSVSTQLNLPLSGASAKSGGVGSSSMRMRYIAEHDLRLGELDLSHLKIVALDLSHVNVGLARKKTGPISGVIGADVFKQHNAMIDYVRMVMILKS